MDERCGNVGVANGRIEYLLVNSQDCLKDRFWPSLCEKSDHNETVGKLCTFPLRLTVKQDEEWDGASKSEAFVFIFPTDNMTPDFLHIDGRPVLSSTQLVIVRR